MRSRLHNSIVLARRFNDASTFRDVVTDGLLDVHVFAGLDRPDGGQGMPMVWRGDTGDVNGLVFKTLSHVQVDGRALAKSLFNLVSTTISDDFVGIDNRRDLTVFAAAESVDMRATATVHADHCDSQLFVRSSVGRETACGGGCQCRCRGSKH